MKKTLHIDVLNKIATYRSRDGIIVCGNSDYQIQFTFDSMWDGYNDKTARFIWNNQYFDVSFSGDICDVPVITDANEVTIGVYAGDIRTTTGATINCQRSILCGGARPNPGTGQHYTTEAQKAAEEAKASAAEAIEAERNAKAVAEALEPRVTKIEQDIATANVKIQENRYRIQDLEKHVGFETIFQTIETSNHSTLDVPENAMRYATIEKIEGHTVGYTQYNGALECFLKNYPKQIVTDKGDVLFDESNLRESEIENLGIEGNYLYIKQGSTNAEGKPLYYFYLHTAREYHEGTSVPSTWKSIYKEFHADGVPYAYIGNLATPTDKNVSWYASGDNTFDLKGVKSIILVPKYTEAELDDMGVGENMDLYQSGTTTFVFELDHTEGV